MEQAPPSRRDQWFWIAGLALPALVVAFFLAARFLPRLWVEIEKVLFTNWRLALIGAAALLLSLAGGWTTWDGMRNFTGESVLSAMFTFGIHGIMLIVAWLIGESFATGMNQVPRLRSRPVTTRPHPYVIRFRGVRCLGTRQAVPPARATRTGGLDKRPRRLPSSGTPAQG